jgi:hypothetical protein
MAGSATALPFYGHVSVRPSLAVGFRLADEYCNEPSFSPGVNLGKKPAILGLRKRPQYIGQLPHFSPALRNASTSNLKKSPIFNNHHILWLPIMPQWKTMCEHAILTNLIKLI